jgi:hypothetical protein
MFGCSLRRRTKLQDRLRAQMMHPSQCAVDVLEHADGVGDHHVIERSLDPGQRRRIFHVAQDKMQTGTQLIGFGNGHGSEIDPDAIGRLQRSEQFPAAAAQFQHPFAGRNQKSHEPPVVLAIGGVELAPAILFAQTGFSVFEEFRFPQIAELRWNSG